jgi:DNA primase
MASYAPAVLDEIRNGVDIVDLVGRFVNLKKAGVNWKGLCPFHAEKTPSFMVNPKKRIFHCFGCGVGGDAFGFLMRQDKLSFPEAVRALAKTAGVTLPEAGDGRAEDSGREELRRAMDLAARFYADALWAPGGESARHYLDSRGIAPEVARRFGLGYAPEGWRALLDFMKSERVAEETLVAAGLVVQREDRASLYDRFRGRLLFAIRDLQGRVVAFGGRAFGDEQPKYLNSPETALYSKGTMLYAADVARETIQAKNRALIVEGYVDCLMAHQYGFTETVAALGTAFTAAQLGLLRRYAEEVVTFFDADAAGQKAAERAEELLEPSAQGATWAVNRAGVFDGGPSFRMRVALLPAGHDPDTFLRAEGADAFEARIRSARSLLAFALDRAIADPDGASGPRARANAFARAALLLAKVGDAQEAAALSRQAAAGLGVDPTQLWTESRRLQSALLRPSSASRPVAAPTTVAAVERDLVTLLLHAPDARARLLPLLDERELGHEPLRLIVGALRARPDAPAEGLLADLPDTARNLVAAFLMEERADEDPPATIAQFARRLERQQALRRMRELSRGIAETQTEAALPHDEFRTLTREGKSVLEFTRGVGSSPPTGPTGKQGVHTND